VISGTGGISRCGLAFGAETQLHSAVHNKKADRYRTLERFCIMGIYTRKA